MKEMPQMGNLLKDQVESLLVDYLELSLSLKELVDQFQIEDDDEDEDVDDPINYWITTLEKRQNIIDRLSDYLSQGYSFSDYEKENYLKKVYDLEQAFLPLMESKRKAIETKLGQLKRSKQANQQYQGYGGYTPYGAFFDKKK